MPSLDMGVSYDLTYDEIERCVTDGSIGNYAFGYLDEHGVFIVCYVGRSDTNLKERIKHGITDKEDHPNYRYERFKFSYAESDKEAYEKEGRNYHDFGGDEGLLINKDHPAKPQNVDCSCPICRA